MKKLFIFLFGILLLAGSIFLISASHYTPPSYSNINLQLNSSYTAPSYSNITLILEPSGGGGEPPSDCWTYDEASKLLTIPSGCLYNTTGLFP